MLVVCILLNLTTREQVEPILPDLFTKYPDAEAMRRADPVGLKHEIESLGLGNRRAQTLIKFSADWARWEEKHGWQFDWPHPDKVRAMHGIGPYAIDSYNFFVVGNTTRMLSRDKKLSLWLGSKGIGVGHEGWTHASLPG